MANKRKGASGLRSPVTIFSPIKSHGSEKEEIVDIYPNPKRLFFATFSKGDIT